MLTNAFNILYLVYIIKLVFVQFITDRVLNLYKERL